MDTMKFAFLTALLVLGACGSSDPEQGPCVQRAGTFRLTYVQRSGTCGPIAEQVATIDSQSTPIAPCTGEVRNSADNCEVTEVNVVCPEPGVSPTATSTTNGKIAYTFDGSSGLGVVSMVVTDGPVLCQGSYNVSVTRL